MSYKVLSRRPPNPATSPSAVKKIPAASVRYGLDISRNGHTVWGAYDLTGVLRAVGATAGEARKKYDKWWSEQATKRREAQDDAHRP
jgi:hypothetical protein